MGWVIHLALRQVHWLPSEGITSCSCLQREPRAQLGWGCWMAAGRMEITAFIQKYQLPMSTSLSITILCNLNPGTINKQHYRSKMEYIQMCVYNGQMSEPAPRRDLRSLAWKPRSMNSILYLNRMKRNKQPHISEQEVGFVIRRSLQRRKKERKKKPNSTTVFEQNSSGGRGRKSAC